MDTSVGYRAPRAPRVPLDEVMIKLAPEGFHEEFEADGLNVGLGGLSVRAAVLPEVGSRLRCEFEASDEDDPIQVIGEVVWAHESGPYMGEFGIRFAEVAEPDQDRIAEIIYRWQRETKADSERSPTVRLALQGVSTPIVATLTAETEDGIEVEQPLPFLTIGTEIENETMGRRGRLEGVELRLEDETPRLVLTIGYEESGPAAVEEGRDTIPDAHEIKPEQPKVVVDSAPAPVPVKVAPTVQTLTRLKSIMEATARTSRRAWSKARAVVLEAWTLLRWRVYPPCRDALLRSWTVSSRFVSALIKKLRGEPRRRKQRRPGEPVRSRTGVRVMRVGFVAVMLALGIGWTTWWLRADEPTSPPAEPVTMKDAVAPTLAPEPRPEPAPSAPSSAPARVDGLVFGADEVRNGEKFVLRMSNPIHRIEGVAEAQGFSVTIPNSLSLSRAGPIAAAHPDVERAMILNRGNYSEFTLRFVDGRAPDYRVEAVDGALEVTIER